MLSEKYIHTHTTNVIGGILCLKVSIVLAESCKQTKNLAYKIIHLFYPLSQVQDSTLPLRKLSDHSFLLKLFPLMKNIKCT